MNHLNELLRNKNMNTAILARRTGIILCLGVAALVSGYFSLALSVGTATVMDPRDILVVCAGVLTGPAGGALVGFMAGFPGSDPLVEISLYMVSGLAVGAIARYCVVHKVWMPFAALGLGCGYVLAGSLLMVTSWYGEVAAYAFRSLIMQNICILFLYILDSLDPRIFSWEKNLAVGNSHLPS